MHWMDVAALLIGLVIGFAGGANWRRAAAPMVEHAPVAAEPVAVAVRVADQPRVFCRTRTIYARSGERVVFHERCQGDDVTEIPAQALRMVDAGHWIRT